ncbi:MAG: hypothetical protein ACPW61_10505 [Methyloligella sp. ZOD6]
MSMSGEPISAPETAKSSELEESWTIQELINAGWREADLDWENAAARTVQALARGDTDSAKDAAGAALRLARESFDAIDPRLGTSLANYGACLWLAGDRQGLRPLVQTALETWRASGPWIARLTAPRVARSSMFHLRMEALHRDTYRARWQQRWQEIAADAAGRLQALNDGLAAGDTPALDVPAETMLATWKRERPAMLNDTRKLLGAGLLLLVS